MSDCNNSPRKPNEQKRAIKDDFESVSVRVSVRIRRTLTLSSIQLLLIKYRAFFSSEAYLYAFFSVFKWECFVFFYFKYMFCLVSKWATSWRSPSIEGETTWCKRDESGNKFFPKNKWAGVCWWLSYNSDLNWYRSDDATKLTISKWQPDTHFVDYCDVFLVSLNV